VENRRWREAFRGKKSAKKEGRGFPAGGKGGKVGQWRGPKNGQKVVNVSKEKKISKSEDLVWLGQAVIRIGVLYQTVPRGGW